MSNEFFIHVETTDKINFLKKFYQYEKKIQTLPELRRSDFPKGPAQVEFWASWN